MSVNEKMTAIADAIREKTGGTEALTLDGMAESIQGMPTAGGDYTNEQITALIDRTITEFSIPYGTVTVGKNAFSQCSSLQSVDIPDSVTTIAAYAFNGCSNVNEMVIPDSVTEIGADAFYSCGFMKISKLPANLITVGYRAFGLCYGMSGEILIPPGVREINADAFQKCNRVTAFTFTGTPDSIASSVFNACASNLIINVPWAEGEVANAPWGATSATINYNYTEA